MIKNTICYSLLYILIFYFNISKVFGQSGFRNLEVRDTTSIDSTIKLFINPEILTEKEKAIFINALSLLAIKNNYYDTIRVTPKQNLYSIINSNYKYHGKNNFRVADIIRVKIEALNSLTDKYTLYTGDSLSVPIVPTNPAKNSTKLFTQVINLINSTSFVSSTINLFSLEKSTVSENIQQEKAGLWMYNITQNDLKSILDSIPNEVQKKLYGSGYITYDDPRFVELSFPSTLDTSNTIIKISPSSNILNNTFSEIEFKNFGLYYVLDFFNGTNCTHGQKVMSVISQRLNEYGLSSIMSKVKPIPINYFQNEDSALAFLKSYYASKSLPYLSKLEGEYTINSLKKIKDQNIKSCERCIPEIYLDACMKHYYGNKPDIISASFYITTYRDIMPNYVNSTTNFITACLNEPGKIIEDLSLRESTVNGTSNGSIQPLYASWLNYARVGSIIVGCQIDTGKYYGMYSSTGEGVTTLGKGIGWGSNNDCIKPTEKGASFATPDVAIKLLIAKAYWRSKNYIPSAIEARTRLLLCSDLDTSFIGKFASAGMPNLSKLILLSTAVAEDITGSIIECDISDNSFLEFDQNSKYPFSRGSSGISGISLIKDKVYAFFESSLCWKRINVKKIFIKISFNGKSETFTTIEDLQLKYKQLIKLKN